MLLGSSFALARSINTSSVLRSSFWISIVNFANELLHFS